MKAVYPGSFDPITIGHYDIISRAAKIFERLYVVVMINPDKKAMFSARERADLIKKAVDGISNVEVCVYDGLLVDFVQQVGAGVIVKGLRAVSDYEYEFQMALCNRRLAPGIETIFLTADAQNMFLSSSAVKQIAGFGGDIADFVPDAVCDEIYKKIVGQKEEVK